MLWMVTAYVRLREANMGKQADYAMNIHLGLFREIWILVDEWRITAKLQIWAANFFESSAAVKTSDQEDSG